MRDLKRAKEEQQGIRRVEERGEAPSSALSVVAKSVDILLSRRLATR